MFEPIPVELARVVLLRARVAVDSVQLDLPSGQAHAAHLVRDEILLGNGVCELGACFWVTVNRA